MTACGVPRLQDQEQVPATRWSEGVAGDVRIRDRRGAWFYEDAVNDAGKFAL